MKIACRVLGLLVIFMIIAVTVYAFIMAGDARSFVAGNESSGDIAGAVQDGANIIGAFLGYIGFVLMCIVGIVLIIYLLTYIISYTRLFFNKCSVTFIRYGATVFGLLSIFAIVMTAINKEVFYKLLIILLITTALMVAYTITTTMYMKKVTAEGYDDDEENENYENNINPNDII